MFLIYDYVALPALYLFVKIASIFNKKIKQGLNDRKNLFSDLSEKVIKIDRTKKLVWVHSSSLGEFEQAKPIIEKLKSDKNILIIVSFFSPSGYRNSINYPHADIVTYLPLDTKQNINRFVSIVKPDMLMLMRYDIWPNLILKLHQMQIPTFIVDATMRKKSKRKWPFIKQFHKSIYSKFMKILTVSDSDVNNFLDFDINASLIKAVGDTRFDRVYQKSLQAKEKKLFPEGFFNNKKVFVFGSSWESDEEVILPAVLKLFKYDTTFIMIIAPHEPTLLKLEKLEHAFAGKVNCIRFSSLNNYSNERVIIVDSIGILLTLYHYADITYVGGSFKQGIHNVLEPAVYGPPVLFGPKIENSHEAKYLSKNNGGVVVSNKFEAYRTLRKFTLDDEYRISIGKLAKEYVNTNIGATEKILEELTKHLKQK
jgi:3-deoxy-D-manno-octulosonic-acid transferase